MPSAPLSDLHPSPPSHAAGHPASRAEPGTAVSPGTTRVRSPQDAAAGLLIAAIGLGALWIGRDWSQGTLAAVQAGFFPRMIGVLLVLFGAAIAGRGLLVRGAALSAWAWRPLAAVTVGVLAFGLALERFGLVAAVPLLVVFGNLAGRPLRPAPLAALGAALTLGCLGVFVWALGLPIKVLP